MCVSSIRYPVQVRKPKLGEKKPSLVQAEIVVDLSAFSGLVREEWEQIRKHDVVFVLAMAGTEYYTPASMMVGDGVEMMDDDGGHDDSGARAARADAFAAHHQKQQMYRERQMMQGNMQGGRGGGQQQQQGGSHRGGAGAGNGYRGRGGRGNGSFRGMRRFGGGGAGSSYGRGADKSDRDARALSTDLFELATAEVWLWSEYAGICSPCLQTQMWKNSSFSPTHPYVFHV